MPGPALLRTTVVALAAALAAGGCASRGTSATESTATTSVTEAAGDPAAGSAAPGGGAPSTGEPTAGGTGSGSARGGGTGGQPGGRATTGAPKASGPAIVYFRVAQQPSCPGGTTATPIAGSPVVVEWKATDVDSVALSVDGPGVYGDNYPPTGSETLNFPCSGAEGDVQRHTYVLTVRNAHGKQTKTLVVTATVHEIKKV